MVRAVIASDVLESFVAAQQSVVHEAKWQIDPNGIRVRAVDPANVAMVDTHLPARATESFEADGKRTLGVDLDRLANVVGMADSEDSVELDLNEQTRKLNIRIGGLEYTLALIDPDAIRQEPDLPDLDLPATVGLPADELARGITAVDLVADYLRLAADPDTRQFVISAEGDTDVVEIALGDDRLASAEVDAAAESLFALNYLADIESVIPSGSTVIADLGTEVPVDMRIEDAGDELARRWLVAPRIQSE